MKSEEVYKIVLSKGDAFTSADSFRLPFVVDYRLNKKSVPVTGKIFCFDTIEHAKASIIPGTLLVGIGTNPTRVRLICGCFAQFKKFWKQKKAKKKITTIFMRALKGTVLVDSFTPTQILGR